MSRKVNFKETKKNPQKVNVNFKTHEGKISFKESKKIPKKVNIRFQASSETREVKQ